MQCITVPAGARVKVTVPEDCESDFEISGVALSIEKEIPEKGRVVLYLTPINEEGKEGNAIAIAPLTVGKSETVKVDFRLLPGNQVIFSTKGDKIDVNVTGFIDTLEIIACETL